MPLSKTRRDLAPALSLGYSSGSGNGVFGLGWSLTYPLVQRRTDKRLPEYEDSTEGDLFLLSKRDRFNVHQNVHQMIQKDRIGYIQIRLGFAEKPLKNRGFLGDSDPRFQFEGGSPF